MGMHGLKLTLSSILHQSMQADHQLGVHAEAISPIEGQAEHVFSFHERGHA